MKTQSQSRLLSLTVASILATSVLVTQNVLADNIYENVSVTSGNTISPVERRIMARSAARVLRHIADARSAIAANDIAKANSDLQQSRNLIDILKSQQPTTKVRDHIWVAKQHLDYDSVEEVAADLVPIEANLTEIESFVPVEKVRVHTRSAHMHLKHGDKAGAKKELEAADAALIYTEIDLPLASTERQVIAAQGALAKQQSEQADIALKQAEEGVQFMSTAIAAPITQARDNIWQATKDYTARHYAAAKAELAKASDWLDRSAKSTDKKTQEETTKLKNKLIGLKGKIGKATEDTEAGLSSLWQHSKALAEREVEKASTAWDKLRGESDAKADLIDAKLHLAYAESEQFIRGKSATVSNELDQAKGYLDKAAKTSDKTLKEKIHAMNDELKQLKANLDDKSAAAHASYDKVKADLRQTIHDL